MDKLNMHTQDLADANTEKIGSLFPNCLTERVVGKDKDGNDIIGRGIDFDRLRQELSKEIVEGPQERYQFTWPGKREAMRSANTPTNMTLRPDRAGSVDFDHTENLYIEGDNLEVLKLLRENYLGKVKMIYIAPPTTPGTISFMKMTSPKQPPDSATAAVCSIPPAVWFSTVSPCIPEIIPNEADF